MVIVVPLVLVFTVNMLLGVVYSLFYRYAQGFYGWFRDLFERLCPILFILISVSLVLVTVVVSPLSYLSIKNEQQLNQTFSTQLQGVSIDTVSSDGHFNYFCFEKSELTSKTFLFLAVLQLAFLCLGAILYLHFYQNMSAKRRVSVLTDKTYRLHFMLFKAAGIQFLVGILFLLIPCVFQCLSYYFLLSNGTMVCLVCEMLMTIHGCVDYITMLYFITPYRRAVLETVFKLCERVTGNTINSKTVMNSLPSGYQTTKVVMKN